MTIDLDKINFLAQNVSDIALRSISETGEITTERNFPENYN